MELDEAIRRRRMVRSFDGRPVPRETLERILDHATRAPSAGFSQGWAFVVLEGDQTDTFWELTTDEGFDSSSRREGLTAAPVIVIPLSHKQAYLERYSEPDKAPFGMADERNWPAPFWDIDTAFASMLILLSAVDSGLGALFFGIARGEKELLHALGVPEGYKPIGAIALGWPDGNDAPSPSLKRGRKGMAQVHWGRW